MTREEHIAFCGICTNRKMNMKVGLICSLTNKIADFEEECPSFNLDASERQQVLMNELRVTGHQEAGEEIDPSVNENDGTLLIILGILILILAYIFLRAFFFKVLTVGLGLVLLGFRKMSKARQQQKILEKEQEFRKKL